MAKKKGLPLYEVHMPMPYCEVYRVRAKNKKHARKLVEAGFGECIGEITSRKQIEKRLKE